MKMKKQDKFIEAQKRVILIHGYNSSPKVFNDIKDDLQSKGVIVYPLTYNSAKDYKAWLRHINKKINEIQDKENLYVVGHSLGGALALYLSQKHKFKGLVTINSPVYIRNHFLINLLAKTLSRKYKKFRIKRVTYSLESVRSIFQFLNKVKEASTNTLDSALIIQSKKDKVVNPRSAKILYNHIEIENKQLVNAGFGHSPLSQPPIINTITGFMGLA